MNKAAIVAILVAAVAPSYAGKYADQSDDQVARAGIALLTGKLHRIESVDAAGKATGTFAHSGPEDFELRRRVYEVVEKDLKKKYPKASSYHLIDQKLADELCRAHVRASRGDAAADKECGLGWKTYESKTKFEGVFEDSLLRGLVIDHLLGAVDDAQFAAAARADFARTAGFTARTVVIDDASKTLWLESVPASKWPAPTVKVALGYAGSD